MIQNSQSVEVSDDNAKTCETLTEEDFGSLVSRLNKEDKSERESIKSSLVNFFTKDPIKSTDVLMKYRWKQPTLPKHTVADLLSAVELVLSKTSEIPKGALEEFLIFALEELTASTNVDPLIQNPALNILVSIGSRHDCKMVMEALTAHAKKGITQNALIFECFSKLSEAEGTGVLPFIKSALPTLYPCLGKLNVNRVRKAKVSAIRSFCEVLLKHSSDIPSSEQDSSQKTTDRTENNAFTKCKTEIHAAYNSLFKQWLHSHNPDVSVDLLYALCAVGSLCDEEVEHPSSCDKRKQPSKSKIHKPPTANLATLSPKKKLSTKNKTDVEKNPSKPIEKVNDYLIKKSKEYFEKNRGRRMCGAAKKRMSYYLSKGLSYKEAKLKALKPMRESPSRLKRHR